MRRAPIVITATVAGIGAVLGFHTQAATVPLAAATSKTTASSTASSSTATATTATKTSTASATKTSSTATRTALGDPMSTRYGPEAVQLQNADSKSVAISGYAEPILRQSALAKQGAAVDAVSGATYTSLSYEGSLQSALDKLGVKAADGSVASTDMSQLQ